jgi:predicted DNA-binding antitoxin AbrB/MazE fold protein
MALVIEAVYEDGVLKPVGKLDLPEGCRVRLIVAPLDQEGEPPEHRRIHVDPELARAIAEDPEFSLWG